MRRVPAVVDRVRVEPTHRAVLSRGVQIRPQRVVSQLHSLIIFTPAVRGVAATMRRRRRRVVARRQRRGVAIIIAVVGVEKLAVGVTAPLSTTLERPALVLARPVVETAVTCDARVVHVHAPVVRHRRFFHRDDEGVCSFSSCTAATASARAARRVLHRQRRGDRRGGDEDGRREHLWAMQRACRGFVTKWLGERKELVFFGQRNIIATCTTRVSFMIRSMMTQHHQESNSKSPHFFPNFFSKENLEKIQSRD